MRRALFAGIAGLLAVTGSVSATSARAAAPGLWSFPHRLGRAAADVQLHLNAVGDAVASWYQTDPWDGTRRVMVATKSAGHAWSRSTALTGKSGISAVFSGIGGNGRAVVVWDDGTRGVLWAQHRPGGAWTAPRRLPGISGKAGLDVSSFDMSRSGLGVIAWSNFAGQAFVRIQHRDGGWDPSVAITAAPSSPLLGSRNVRAVIADSGNVVATWLQVRRDTPSEYYGDWQRGGINVNGRVRRPHTMMTRQTDAPQLTKSPSGRAVAVYSPHQKPALIFFRLAVGYWRIYQVSDPATTDVAVAVSDTVAHVWHVGAWKTDPRTAVYAARFDSDGWTGPRRIFQTPVPSVRRLRGAAANGAAIVAWSVQPFGAGATEDARIALIYSAGGVTNTHGVFGSAGLLGVTLAGPHAALWWRGDGITARTL